MNSKIECLFGYHKLDKQIARDVVVCSICNTVASFLSNIQLRKVLNETKTEIIIESISGFGDILSEVIVIDKSTRNVCWKNKETVIWERQL